MEELDLCMYLSTHVPMYSCTHVLTVEADVDLPGEGDGGVGVGGLTNKLPAQVLPLQQETPVKRIEPTAKRNIHTYMVVWRS